MKKILLTFVLLVTVANAGFWSDVVKANGLVETYNKLSPLCKIAVDGWANKDNYKAKVLLVSGCMSYVNDNNETIDLPLTELPGQ